MYSRYIPKPGGGYDRRLVPEGAERVAVPPEPAPQAELRRETGPVAGGAHGPDPPRRGPPLPMGGPPPGHPPPRPGMGGFPGPGGSAGLLGRLLPRLDTEELLVLAVLLLAMKQDGASTTELLLAAGLYLWL